MSVKGIRGNPELRRGVGSKTTDSEKIMEDPPAGDWLALRSDQLLKWIDDAVYNNVPSGIIVSLYGMFSPSRGGSRTKLIYYPKAV